MLTPPKYAPNAKADVLGWRDRRTGELLEVRRHTPEQVEEYEAARLVVEEHVSNRLEDKTKAKLIEIAEEEGVEYAPSWTKAKLVEAIEAHRAAPVEFVEDGEESSEEE